MTVSEDLKTLIDANWADGLSKTFLVFMKEDRTSKEMDPPRPSATEVIGIIFEAVGSKFRITQGSDLTTYDALIIMYTQSYTNMKTALAEMKEIFDDYSDAGTDGYFITNDPTISGEGVSMGKYASKLLVSWTRMIVR